MGQPEVVQEVLADLKTLTYSPFFRPAVKNSDNESSKTNAIKTSQGEEMTNSRYTINQHFLKSIFPDFTTVTHGADITRTTR